MCSVLIFSTSPSTWSFSVRCFVYVKRQSSVPCLVSVSVKEVGRAGNERQKHGSCVEDLGVTCRCEMYGLDGVRWANLMRIDDESLLAFNQTITVTTAILRTLPHLLLMWRLAAALKILRLVPVYLRLVMRNSVTVQSASLWKSGLGFFVVDHGQLVISVSRRLCKK